MEPADRIYEGKMDFLQNNDIVLDSNSISYSLDKNDPAFAGQISYSPTPFPNTPIRSRNNKIWNLRQTEYFLRVESPNDTYVQ